MNTITRTAEDKAIRNLNALKAKEEIEKGHSRIKEVFFATVKDGSHDDELKAHKGELFRVARQEVFTVDPHTREQVKTSNFILITARVINYGFYPTTLNLVVARETLTASRKDGKLVEVGKNEKEGLIELLSDFGIF